MALNPNSNTFIFDNVQYQNSANTVVNYAEAYNVASNAVVTGNTYKYKTDYERMQSLIGKRGQLRPTGYFNYLVTTFYNLTFTDGVTLPSTAGPGNTGWGTKIGTAILNPNSLNDDILTKYTGQGNYVIVAIRGYIYSPQATTVQIKTTSDDGVLVQLNGTNIISNWTYHGTATDTSSVVTLVKGYNPLVVYYFEGAGSAVFTLAYRIGSGEYYQDGTGVFFHNYQQL